MQWLPTPIVAETYYGVTMARSDTTEQEAWNHLLGYPLLNVDEEWRGRWARCWPLRTVGLE